jgi:hypothetical protein
LTSLALATTVGLGALGFGMDSAEASNLALGMTPIGGVVDAAKKGDSAGVAVETVKVGGSLGGCMAGGAVGAALTSPTGVGALIGGGVGCVVGGIAGEAAVDHVVKVFNESRNPTRPSYKTLVDAQKDLTPRQKESYASLEAFAL